MSCCCSTKDTYGYGIVDGQKNTYIELLLLITHTFSELIVNKLCNLVGLQIQTC